MNTPYNFLLNITKLLLCLIFFEMFAATMQAQSWPEPGATWEYCFDAVTVWDNEGTKRYSYTTDTTINEKSYAVIRHISTNDQVFEAGTEYDYRNRVYLRTSNDTIFRNVQGIDHLFYINGLGPGDGYTTYRSAINNFDEYSCNPEIHLEVIEVSTVEIGGEMYTQVRLEDTNFTDVYGPGDAPPQYTFVEDVGLRNDFPFVYPLGYDAQNEGGPECYLATDGGSQTTLNKYSSEAQFIDFDVCFSVSVQENEISNISVFPNPVSENFSVENLKADINTILSLTLYGHQGQQIKSFNPQNHFHSLNEFSTGLYILKIETTNGIAWKKLVKE